MAQLNNTPETELTSLAERHKSILDILQLQGSVSVSDLAERLEVSEVTIRKDLSALEKQNKLYRTHGRAIPISPYIGDRHINEKEKQFVLEKRAIGKVAASMVNEHDSILMASGSRYFTLPKNWWRRRTLRSYPLLYQHLHCFRRTRILMSSSWVASCVKVQFRWSGRSRKLC